MQGLVASSSYFFPHNPNYFAYNSNSIFLIILTLFLTILNSFKAWVLQSHKVLSKSDQKQKFFITRIFFVNKQLTLFFNYLKNSSLNFAQNFRECSFNLAGSESGEKSRCPQLFAYISQLFVYKTRLWT